MSRRPTPPPQRAELTPDKMRLGIQRLERRIAEVEAFHPGAAIRSREDTSSAEALAASVEGTLVQTFGHDTLEYRRYSQAAMFSWPINLVDPTPLSEIQESLRRCRTNSLALLRQAVSFLKEELESADENPKLSAAQQKPHNPNSRRVFLVHGHASAEQAVARFLERIGFEPIILHEQANQGRTIIEKFEVHSDVGFAVVLMTPDDKALPNEAPPGSTFQFRARQNVILELGYFIGRLGRDRVCALNQGNLELPSDILGVAWLPLDEYGAWQQKLAKELEAAGYSVDWNKVMRA